jgi:hypothetical protein
MVQELAPAAHVGGLALGRRELVAELTAAALDYLRGRGAR